MSGQKYNFIIFCWYKNEYLWPQFLKLIITSFVFTLQEIAKHKCSYFLGMWNVMDLIVLVVSRIRQWAGQKRRAIKNAKGQGYGERKRAWQGRAGLGTGQHYGKWWSYRDKIYQCMKNPRADRNTQRLSIWRAGQNIQPTN